MLSTQIIRKWKSKITNTIIAFSEEYKIQCRTAWYSAGRPTEFEKIFALIPFDEHNRKPKIRTLRQWKSDMLWDLWADELDAKAMTLVENDLIQQKADMLKRHADMAKELMGTAWDYLKAEGFDTSSSAVSAIIKGAELERTSRGIGEMLVKMATMNDMELKDTIIQYINRASDAGQIIDADEVPEKEEKEDESTDS